MGNVIVELCNFITIEKQYYEIPFTFDLTINTFFPSHIGVRKKRKLGI